MNSLQIFTLAILALTANCFKLPGFEGEETHWAVLVAGSSGIENYRHQSDICHAYQILINNGMNPDKIITLAYDDIAYDEYNPIQGKIFNKPDPKGKGVDVYKGCKIDYRKKQVNPKTFLNILQGNRIKYGSKKTLKSTSEDNVFVYFSDHGGVGLIAFPDSFLYANKLIQALTNMHSKKMYKKLVFYLEACESGSMFKKLPKNINIYATSAANAKESSWATYCPPHDKVDGKSMDTCLGDEYSVNFLEDNDADKGLTKTLDEQFNVVKQKTKHSHVQRFGDMSFVNDEINNYEAGKQKTDYEVPKISQEYADYLEKAKQSVINSRNVRLMYLYNRFMFGKGNQRALEGEILHRKRVDAIFAKFKVQDKDDIDVNFECLEPAVESFKGICNERWSDYSLKYVRTIAILCEKVSADVIIRGFKSFCQ